ncbi:MULTISPECIES: efflux RND transporter periplasmic adaptor subunit [unclassified Carboxylicivirga]|uniref:efflux RND transporter periplasmic adaptor subunit n=1 Tax=Carboxylicivirga TaxID=1628153 RepID=UPI003D324BC8
MRKILLLGVTSLLIASCGTKEQTADTGAAVMKKPIKTTPVVRKTIEVEENYTATINAYDKVYLAPNTPGRIKDIKVEVNDYVRKGQRVIDMDDTQLVQQEVNFANITKEMARMDTLIKYGSISQQVYDQTKATYDAAKASLNNLRENTVLNAPFSGIVTGRYYDDNEIYSGSPIANGKAAVVTIESIDRLKVEINMSERFFPVVKRGLKTTLSTDIYPNEQFQGEVSLVYPTIDPATRTFTVEITIPNDEGKLRPGMFSKVDVKLGEKETIVVPASTVMILDGTNQRYVFVEKNGTAKFVKVDVGARFDDRLEILSDEINEGDNLVVAGQVNLNDGDLVEVKS